MFMNHRFRTIVSQQNHLNTTAKHRGGMSLMVVMVAVSSSLVLTYSFLRTQTTTLQITQNGLHQDYALQAAQTGASIALETMQWTDWDGVESVIEREVISNSDGTSSFEVTFNQLEPRDGERLPPDALIHVVVKSKGIWQSASDDNQIVEKWVEVVVKLQPRLPGRTIGSGDLANATDMAPNPGDYDAIQTYSLFAKKGSKSLVLDPGDRIDGKIWLKSRFQLYDDPRWSSSVRTQVLNDLGSQYLSTVNGRTVVKHPHPLAGEIVFGRAPSSSNRKDLARIGTPWSVSHEKHEYPQIDWNDWRDYRLYEGGFEYESENLRWRLSNVVKRPTVENPLGILYRRGDLRIRENVTIQGTIVCAGRVTIEGHQVHIASYNWTGSGGKKVVDDARLWPRLPAIVAKEVYYARDVQSVVDGAIVVKKSLKGAGGDFEYVDVPKVAIDGTATARPSTQPWSLVQVGKKVNLNKLSGNSRYSIWLEDGATDGWYGIHKVDSTHKSLTVWGEVTHESRVNFKIRRNRRRYVDIRGPVSGEKHDINRLPDWDLSSSSWNARRDGWEDTNDERSKTGLDRVSFLDWLANLKNFDDWGFPLEVHGLKLEPTFHLRNTKDVHHHWSPPLFAPFAGSTVDDSHSGFRWKVVSWREINSFYRGDTSNGSTIAPSLESNKSRGSSNSTAGQSKAKSFGI